MKSAERVTTGFVPAALWARAKPAPPSKPPSMQVMTSVVNRGLKQVDERFTLRFRGA
jgi:hypothetical protein